MYRSSNEDHLNAQPTGAETEPRTILLYEIVCYLLSHSIKQKNPRPTTCSMNIKVNFYHG